MTQIQKIDNRLKRLIGQLQKVQTDIQQEKDCAEVMLQFMAVKGALGSAFESYVQLSLDACVETDREKTKKLITILTKS